MRNQSHGLKAPLTGKSHHISPPHNHCMWPSSLLEPTRICSTSTFAYRFPHAWHPHSRCHIIICLSMRRTPAYVTDSQNTSSIATAERTIQRMDLSTPDNSSLKPANVHIGRVRTATVSGLKSVLREIWGSEFRPQTQVWATQTGWLCRHSKPEWNSAGAAGSRAEDLPL